MDPITLAIAACRAVHITGKTIGNIILRVKLPTAAAARRLLATVERYQAALKSFEKAFVNRTHQKSKESVDQLRNHLETDVQCLKEIEAAFLKIGKRSKLANIIMPSLVVFTTMERRLYDRISMLTLLIETGRLEADEKDKKAVRRALRNKEARLLWFRHIGVNDRHAPLRQLVQGIEKYMKEVHDVHRLPKLDRVLDAVCNLDSNKSITALEFGECIKRFGPLPNLFLKAACCVDISGVPEPWFRKDFTRLQAEKELSKGRSYFYVRYSSKATAAFALSLRTLDGVMIHTLINNSDDGFYLADDANKGVFDCLLSCVEAFLNDDVLNGKIREDQRKMNYRNVTMWAAEIENSTGERQYPTMSVTLSEAAARLLENHTINDALPFSATAAAHVPSPAQAAGQSDREEVAVLEAKTLLTRALAAIKSASKMDLGKQYHVKRSIEHLLGEL